MMAVILKIGSFFFNFGATLCLIFILFCGTFGAPKQEDLASGNFSLFFNDGRDTNVLPSEGDIVVLNENEEEDGPENDGEDVTTTFISAFYANSTEQRVKALRRLEGRRLWYGGGNNRDDNENEMRDTRTVECLCEVTINGRHHVSGEVAVCGMANRIQCPHNVGCQKAVATTSNGFVSIVKSCGIGNELSATGCRTRREQAPYVDRINVMRCICMGRLCNHGVKGQHEVGSLVWILLVSAVPIIVVGVGIGWDDMEFIV